MMRTATTIILLVGMTVMLLSCGLADGGQKAPDSEGGATSVAPGTPPSMVTPLSASPDAPTRRLEKEQVSEDSEASASSQETIDGVICGTAGRVDDRL